MPEFPGDFAFCWCHLSVGEETAVLQFSLPCLHPFLLPVAQCLLGDPFPSCSLYSQTLPSVRGMDSKLRLHSSDPQ